MTLSDIPDLGPKRVAALKEYGINTLWDLLKSWPREWLDEQKITQIKDVKEGKWVVLAGQIIEARIDRRGKPRFNAILQDSSGRIELVFFGKEEYLNYWQSKLKNGMRLFIKGEATTNKYNKFSAMQISHPEWHFFKENEEYKGSIIPVYTKTESMKKAKLSKKIFAETYKYLFGKNLSLILPPEENACPPELLSFLGFQSTISNLKKLHCPQNWEDIYAGKKELKILALLPFCLRKARRRRLLANSGISRKLDYEKINFTKENLPWALTAGQSQVLEQIKTGLESERQFHALLQGDVGSGKTVIAMLAMIGICGAGVQSACMVPTDILARQHFSSMEEIFKNAGLKLVLLVGAMGAAERREILAGLKSGEINAVVGTHALFSKDVEFDNLGFVIIDEQHRFGVRQREALLEKGNKPDLLVMSATPIPRSLAMTFYGDLEAIILREKPPGRKDVKTEMKEGNVRESMKNYLYKQSLADNRCYWVVSRVQEDEFGVAASVANIYDELKKFKSDWKIAVVHGQMPEAERDANLRAFAKGEVSLLVCTTVVEVGVNVPEANLMVIDRPESFGLAQLHQLRGRVGRGSTQAWCILLCEESNTAYERLKRFSATNDGFEIAEIDLQNRGAGNLEGSEQSGAWILRWFDWIQDQPLIEKTINTANDILDNKNFSPEVLQKIQDWYNDKKFEKIEDGVH
ncbi:MAG: ATP-dependent DNA helicase RecG [Fibromonadaceae bacterium]|nr:ATP-dependent DNA helicase RecG [Fibromonadaceae bacterium]